MAAAWAAAMKKSPVEGEEVQAICPRDELC